MKNILFVMAQACKETMINTRMTNPEYPKIVRFLGKEKHPNNVMNEIMAYLSHCFIHQAWARQIQTSI